MTQKIENLDFFEKTVLLNQVSIVFFPKVNILCLLLTVLAPGLNIMKLMFSQFKAYIGVNSMELIRVTQKIIITS